MLEASGISDTGLVRSNNEDSFLVLPEHGLYVVADGMGGAQAGEHASRLAVDALAEHIRHCDQPDESDLAEAFEEANRMVLDAAAQDASLDGMGTTLLAALESGADLLIASVGDSRAYVYEKGRFLAITQDQTWVEEVGRRLGIDEASLKNHPMRHVLTMAIGVSPQLRVHSYRVTPAPKAQILLCSDGLHGVVDPEVIAGVLAKNGPLQAKCQQLVDAAKVSGAPDNVTAVLIQRS